MSVVSASARRLCAIAAVVSVAALSGCATPEPVKPPPPPPPVTEPAAPHQLSADRPEFFRLPNMAADRTPLRVGVILPMSNASPATRQLAGAMLKAAEMALYDSGSRDIVLMTADDSGRPQDAATAAIQLLDKGAEVLVGPLFAQSVTAVAPLARDRGVPVIAFSTDRTVAGDGVYLLSFQPENEVERVVTYAASQGRKTFAALIPDTAYGRVAEQAFRQAVTASGATVSMIQHYSAAGGPAADQTAAIAKTAPDALFIAQGGNALRSLAPTLALAGIDPAQVRLLGTGVWDDPANGREPSLAGAWFAAPAPQGDADFVARYRDTFGAPPPTLAVLAYDAISLVALIGQGKPYHRFTKAALTDPNGFAGVDGIFRFNKDGSIERGLSVLAVRSGTFAVVSPAPTTFQAKGS